jgi:hypothetical protein
MDELPMHTWPSGQKMSKLGQPDEEMGTSVFLPVQSLAKALLAEDLDGLGRQ